MTSARLLLIGLGTLLCSAAFAAATPTLQDANQAFKQGQYPAALEKVNAYLSKNPKEAQARFLKGLVLTELNRAQDAIRVFTDLTEDYPELPEPYNNLAVLYAAQGQFDKAKNSLEMAIRTHPSYATAHENLGDIYAKMASQAYDKALQLDKANVSAQTKLSLIRDIFGPTRLADAGRNKQTLKPAVTKTATLATEPAPPIPDMGARDKPADAAKPAADGAKSDTKTDATPAKPAAKVPTLPADPKAAAQKLMQAWADAWSRRDADAYLAFYAEDYKADKKSHAEWAEERRVRVTRPTSIKVELSNLKIDTKGNQTVVTFRQRYESNILKANSTKRITLEKQAGTWKIVEER